jgi:hypothetical protein
MEFVVKREVVNYVLDFKAISERICSIRQPMYIRSVCTNRKNGDANKDQSCQFMGTAHDSTPNDMVIADLNVKLG